MANFQSVESACKTAISKGSLSFTMASRLLGRREQTAIYSLYAWCRWCDNVIDELPPNSSCENQERVLATLREQTQSSLEQRYNGDNYVFIALQRLACDFSIPHTYFYDLLLGMQMDINHQSYRTFEDLRLYCYRVAGVVGIIYSYIVGVRNAQAIKNAVALGTAMQLTNIARDVSEDFARGRIYIPLDMRELIIQSSQNFLSIPNRQLLWGSIVLLIRKSEEFYRQGQDGIFYLPWKAALAAQAALNIYSAIGQKILKLGPGYLESRTYIKTTHKVYLLTKAIFQVFLQFPKRLMVPFARDPLVQTWRYS